MELVNPSYYIQKGVWSSDADCFNTVMVVAFGLISINFTDSRPSPVTTQSLLSKRTRFLPSKNIQFPMGKFGLFGSLRRSE